MTATIGGQVQIEHYHRYLYARALCRDADVLDVASGEGYGSALLAQVARRVVGVEYAASTVANAAANFPRDNLRFVRGDAHALPLADASCDRVVSFETIEHFAGQEEFLREIRRVLRPDGLLIVSTPDRDVYSPPGAPANPFHVRELTCVEFDALLRLFFTRVVMLRQRPLVGSALLADTASMAAPLVFDRRDAAYFEACAGVPRAPYVIAVAANGSIPPLPPSVFIERSDLDTTAMQLAERTQEVAQRDSELAALRHTLDAAREDADGARVLARNAEAARVEALAAQAAAAKREHELAMRLDLLGGSLRGFLRGYLPRLMRHLRR